MIVCVCHNISERELRVAIHRGVDNMHALREHLGIGTDCGKCKSCAKKIVRECEKENHKSTYPMTLLRQIIA